MSAHPPESNPSDPGKQAARDLAEPSDLDARQLEALRDQLRRLDDAIALAQDDRTETLAEIERITKEPETP